MLILSKRILTLDIDSTSVRLLSIRGRRVERWASTPIEPGLIRDGLITDPSYLGARVKQLMEASQMKGRRAITSLSGLYSITRIMRVPLQEGQLIYDAVLKTARQAMPHPDELYLSWQVVATGDMDSRVLVFGIPQDIVDAEIQALKSARINPYIINLKGMALMRLVDREQALVVNKEPDSMDIVLVNDGIPHIMQTVQLRDNMSPAEWVDCLGHSLDRITYFYNSRHPLRPFSPAAPLFLTGQLPGYLNIVRMVNDKTGYPIAPPAIPLEYPPNLPVPQYAVNIGLALQNISIPKWSTGYERLSSED